MDTRSSSGSGSHSTNPTRVGPHATQQATYTTAGTVYNPQTAPPLQPPARRGRAARWPPAIPADLAVFNNSVAGGFPRSRFRSPPTTASTLKHYTPLQQNQDRAVDPTQRMANNLFDSRLPTSGNSSTMSLANALPRQLLSENMLMPKRISCDECGEEFQNLEAAHFHIMISGHDSHAEPDSVIEADDESNSPDGDELLPTDDGKDEECLAQFNNYSVKTLTNLASYPNPNQKMAQKCLDRARKTYKFAPGASSPASRNSSRPGFDGAGAPASASLGGVGRENQAYYSRVPRNAHMTSSTRSSVLSNGPGAPQPLTAGPPGQRQYKASTLEGPLRALQESAQNPFLSDVSESRFSTPMPTQPAVHHPVGRSTSTKMPEPSRSTQQEMMSLTSQNATASPSSAEQTAQWAARHAHGRFIQRPNVIKPWAREIQETRTQDEIRGYYQGGRVWDYNAAGLVSPHHGDNSDLLPFRRCQRLTTEATKKADLDRHRNIFYAKKDDILKPFEDRYNEIREEARARELGLIHPSEGRSLTVAQMDAAIDSSQLGKPQAISMDVINNKVQKSDAARQLLGLTYAALYEGRKRLHGIAKPEAAGNWPVHEWGYIGQEKEAKIAAQTSRVSPQTLTPLDTSPPQDDLSW